MSRVAVTGRKLVRAAVGESVNFNGTSGSINVPDAAQLDLTSSYSVFTWIFPRSSGEGAGGRVISKAGAYEFVTLGNGQMNLSNTSTGVSSANNLYRTFVPQHVGAVYDDAANTVQFYQNGVAFGTAVAQTVNPTATANPLLLGNRAADDRTLDGWIHETLIFTGTKTAAQAKELFLGGITLPQNQVNLVFWGKANTGSAVYVDNSSYGNNGAITTATVITTVPPQFGARVRAVGRVLAANRVLIYTAVFMLLETGGALLLENGGKIIL